MGVVWETRCVWGLGGLNQETLLQAEGSEYWGVGGEARWVDGCLGNTVVLGFRKASEMDRARPERRWSEPVSSPT